MKEKIRKFYLETIPKPSIRQVARKFGCSVSNVVHHLKDMPEYRERNKNVIIEIKSHMKAINNLLKEIK